MLIHLLDSQGDGEIDSFEWTTTLRQVGRYLKSECSYHFLCCYELFIIDLARIIS